MTSVNDKKLQDTLLHLNYYVEKGEMETAITQLDDVIYASSSPDLYFKDVTDNTISYLSASGGFEFYEDSLLQLQRNKAKLAKNPLRAIKRANKIRNDNDREWAKKLSTDMNKKYNLKGKDRIKWQKKYKSLKFRREHEDELLAKRVGAHEENKGIKKSIAEFTRKLFEGKQNSTSAATGVLAALLNNGEKVDWTTDNINDWINKQSIQIERGGKKLKIKYDKQNDGFDVFDLDKLKRLNSKPISSFSDAWGVANKAMGGSGGGTTVSFGDTGSKSGTKAANIEAISGGMNNFLKWFGAEFKRGYAEGYDRSLERHGFPSGKTYRDSPQHFWEVRAQLATEYAIGTDRYEREAERINKMTDENSTAEERNAAKKSAWNDWLKVRSKVGEEANKIGSNLNDVVTHVNKIKNPSDHDALPPVSGWPSRYGGRNRVIGLQKNLPRAKLSSYSNDTFGGQPGKEPEKMEPEQLEREEEANRTEEEANRSQKKQNNNEWEEWENRKIPDIDSNERQEEDNKFEGMPSHTILTLWARAQETLGLDPDDEDFQEQWKNSSAYAYYRQAQLKEWVDKYDRWNDMSSQEIFSEWARESGIDTNGQLSFEDREKWLNSQEHKWFSDIEKKEIAEAAEQKALERRREIEQFMDTGEPIPPRDGQGEQQVQQEQDPNMANPSGEEGDGGGSGDDVPPEFREYLEGSETPPEGIPLLTGSKRGQEGSSSSFYDKRVAAAKKQQQVKGGEGIAVPGQAGWDEGKQQAGFTSGSTQGPQGQLNLADDNEMTGDNKMAKPVNDYKEIIEQAVDKAKQQQSKSKIRSAKAQARVAKAHANEAEANAEAAEQKADEKIASIIHKLDSNISELNARRNPEISSVLSKLDSTIRFAKSNTKKN